MTPTVRDFNFEQFNFYESQHNTNLYAILLLEKIQSNNIFQKCVKVFGY